MSKKILSRSEAKNQKRAIVLITLFCLPIVALYFTFSTWLLSIRIPEPCPWEISGSSIRRWTKS